MGSTCVLRAGPLLCDNYAGQMIENQGYKLEIEERDGYLYVLYGGNPLTLEMIVETINSVARALRSSGLRRVLLVRDSPILDSEKARAMTAQLVNKATMPGVRFAIVDKFGNDPEKTALAVKASREAGWDLTGFDTIDEAADWLKNN